MTDLEEAFRTALKTIDDLTVEPLDLDLGAATSPARRRPRSGWLAAAGIAATLVIGTVLVVGRLPVFAPVQAAPAGGAASVESTAGQGPATPPVGGMPDTSGAVTTGDGSGGGVVPGPSAEEVGDGDVFGSARALPDAPTAVSSAGRANCGSYVLDQGGTVPATALKCLAASGGGRELDVSRPTTEGDPIPLFYIVEPQAGLIDVYSTDAFDRFGGGQGWTHHSCPLSWAETWTMLSGCG